jgi:filamentous hemagglutinin family protein
MLKALFTWLGLALCTLGYLITPNNPAFAEARRALGEETLSEGVSFRTPSFLAQVTSDDTVNTQVSDDGETAEITGGERAGDNLFHSFQDFSVETGDTASFLNANDIANIFSRVTGGNVSNIDGLISANGSANLFLINPAGIIFGENARLDVGGSFYGSTANSILFEDGEYSATDLDNPPVLTINAPIGLNLRDQPGDITVRGDGQGTRTTTDLIDTENALRVDSDKTLALVGGKINLEGATLKTPGGRIELGSLEGNQEVGLTPVNEGFSLDYAGVQNFQDLQLSKTSTVDSSGLVAGDIQIQGKNISLTGDSQIEASTIGDSPSQEPPGTIKINAIDTIKIDGQDSSEDLLSGIFSQVYTDAVGDTGQVTISTTNLALNKAATINANNSGQGNAGSIDINATKSITFDRSSISSTASEGNGGELNITTPNLSLADFSSIRTSNNGRGDGGLIDINATESITLDDNFSNISSTASEGNAGDINITTPNLSLTKTSSIEANASGQGNSGSIDINATESITLLGDSSISSSVESAKGNGGELNITTPNLSLTNYSSIKTNTSGQGNAGLIDINATESITLDEGSINSEGTAFSLGKGNGGDIKLTTPNLSLTDGTISVISYGQGDAGKLSINTAHLSLTNESLIDAGASEGNAGLIDINATESITLNNTSYISITSGSDPKEDGGELNITTPNLSLANGSAISTDTQGKGDGGSIDINATESITLNDSFSDISSSVGIYAEGNGGTINITTNNLGIFDGAKISARSEGQGDAGLIDINANILSLDNSEITAQAFDNANGGNLEIDADVIAAFPNGNSDIRASAEQGQGGNINIDAESIFGIEERPLNDSTNDINASSEFALDGSVNVNVSNINPVQGATELPSNVVEPEQTTAQACQAGRGTANNGLAIAGKGGVTPAPDAPLNSENIISSEQNSAAYAIPKPIETSQGKIQPARGITVTKSGHIVLTAYRTNNAGERIPEAKVNCGQR